MTWKKYSVTLLLYRCRSFSFHPQEIGHDSWKISVIHVLSGIIRTYDTRVQSDFLISSIIIVIIMRPRRWLLRIFKVYFYRTKVKDFLRPLLIFLLALMLTSLLYNGLLRLFGCHSLSPTWNIGSNGYDYDRSPDNPDDFIFYEDNVGLTEAARNSPDRTGFPGTNERMRHTTTAILAEFQEFWFEILCRHDFLLDD